MPTGMGMVVPCWSSLEKAGEEACEVFCGTGLGPSVRSGGRSDAAVRGPRPDVAGAHAPS